MNIKKVIRNNLEHFGKILFAFKIIESYHSNMMIMLILIICWHRTSVECWKPELNIRSVGVGEPIHSLSSTNTLNILKTESNAKIEQDILHLCPLITMCYCSGLPNETSTIIEINCIDVSLFKFPEFLLNNVKYIEFTNTQIQSLDDETFQGLKLESLKLINNRMMEISEKSLFSMRNTLITLDISGNLLQQLPLDALRNLRILSRLIAQRNYITSIDDNWGYLTDSLRSLHLSNNKIFELTSKHSDEQALLLKEQEMIIQKTENIGRNVLLSKDSSANNTLIHSQNSSSRTMMHSFSRLRKLVWLDLSYNRISYISNTALPRSLVTVDLSRNLLITFPQQLFEHLLDLRILSLRDNLIRTISCKDFRLARSHLDKLDLALNHIENIQPDCFQNNYMHAHIRVVNLEKNFIRTLPSYGFRGTEIQHLVISFNKISQIHNNAFDNITDTLEYLDLERNRLNEIPSEINKLRKLKYLYLTSNQIENLSNLQDSGKHLRVLSLSGNKFTSLPIEDLKNYTELSYLNMGYNLISEIQENAFVGWGSHLQTILLRNNKITTLKFGCFNGLDSIKEISLSFNDIVYTNSYLFENISRTLKILELSFVMYREEFPMEALIPLTELLWLSLDNNNLKLITNESFSTMHELTYINLGFNQILKISKNVFHPEIHGHLAEIDLSYNLIEKILSKTFNSLKSLQEINLQSNKIRALERNSFYNMEFLTLIDLSHNKLKNISHSAFAFLPRLINIDLMHNSLCSVSLRMFNFVSNISFPLKLDMSHNRISYFDDDLTSYLYIYNLDISHNFITNSLSFSNLGMSLRNLNLMKNNLSVLGNHAFGDLNFLEVLNLSHNKIASLRRRSFQGLNNLQELDLNYNKLEQLQVEQFSNLKKLRILQIRSNRLSALPREVFTNTHLEYLDISNNQLSVWPISAFSDVGFTLRNIQFVNNQLEYLDSSMFINSQFLYDLNLSSNKITVLPDNTFMFLHNLTNLDLSFNPLVTSNLREVFIHTPRVKKLNICSVRLYVLPNLSLPLLTDLDISANYIQEIYSFREMKQLRKLNISRNKVVNASNILEHLPISLKTLDLSFNPIRRITLNDMSFLRYIDELHLLDIKITNSNIFTKLKNISKIRITASQNFGDIVSRLAGLQELHVYVISDRITNDLFLKLINNTKLKFVEIYGPNVQTIQQDAFLGLSQSQNLKISLRNTKITDLPPSLFYSLRSIPHLAIDISDNRLETLAADSFYPNITFWESVGTRNIIGGLNIANNPLECECGLLWVGHWLRRWIRESAQINSIQKEEIKYMVLRARANTCRDPVTGRNVPILEIFPEDLFCHASALSNTTKSQKFKLSYYSSLILEVYFVLDLIVNTGIKFMHLKLSLLY